MFRFTTRDVLWFTVLVALALGWMLDHRRGREVVKDQRESHSIADRRMVELVAQNRLLFDTLDEKQRAAVSQRIRTLITSPPPNSLVTALVFAEVGPQR